MKKMILLLILVCVLASSCEKMKVAPANSLSEKGQVHITYSDMEGGDDDDKPIIMEIVRDVNGFPIKDCEIVYTMGSDTVTAEPTNDSGYSTTQLPSKGYWYVHVTHTEYVPVNTIVLVDTSYCVHYTDMYQ